MGRYSETTPLPDLHRSLFSGDMTGIAQILTLLLDEYRAQRPALERIADALEARNAIDRPMADFQELLLQGAPQVSHDGMDADLAPDGQPWSKR